MTDNEDVIYQLLAAVENSRTFYQASYMREKVVVQ